MIEVRTKDRLFLAIALPAAIVGAYLYFYRGDAVKRIGSAEKTSAAMISAEDYDFEKAKALRSLASAKEELEAERAAPRPELRLKGEKDAPPAKRESAVLGIFAKAGLGVLRSEEVSKDGANFRREALKAAGVEAVLRRFTLDGSYPAVRRALDAIASEELAAIPEAVEMRESGRARWTISIWL